MKPERRRLDFPASGSFISIHKIAPGQHQWDKRPDISEVGGWMAQCRQLPIQQRAQGFAFDETIVKPKIVVGQAQRRARIVQMLPQPLDRRINEFRLHADRCVHRLEGFDSLRQRVRRRGILRYQAPEER